MPNRALYMHRAMELALLGRGKVSPNPMVGCVVAHNDTIVGEGWHKEYGSNHAEVNAINAVVDKSILPECSLYVNLEPCSHYGKTPPCTDFIIKHGIQKVFVANLDNNPLVAGKGVEKLKNAGLIVQTGILATEGKNLNKRFFAFMQHLRPYIILKWAESADGFMGNDNQTPIWLSNTLSKKIVHQWRSEEDAIIVGTNTAQTDNPQLNVRDWTGRNPIRIVIDKNLRLAKNLHLFDGSQTTFCYNLIKEDYLPNIEYIKIKENDFINHLLADLYSKKIQSLIVEGGNILLNSLLEANLFDEIRIFRTPKSLGKGLPAPQPKGTLVYKEQILDNDLLIFRNEDVF